MFHISKHVSSQPRKSAPRKLRWARRAVPALSPADRGASAPRVSAQHHHQAQPFRVWLWPSHTNKTLFTGTKKHSELPQPSDRHLPDSVKYHNLQPRTLWAPQQCPGLPSPLLLLAFQAAFSNRTPTKTILHKL